MQSWGCLCHTDVMILKFTCNRQIPVLSIHIVLLKKGATCPKQIYNESLEFIQISRNWFNNKWSIPASFYYMTYYLKLLSESQKNPVWFIYEAACKSANYFYPTADTMFLAHLSLYAHWWAYNACSTVCRTSSVVRQDFKTSSHLKPLGQLKPIFIWTPWDGGTKLCSNGPGHMTKMAAIPIYGKNLKNLLLWNQKAYDLETLYVALGARVLPSLFKWWPWVDLDLFYGKVEFGPICFCMGKR